MADIYALLRTPKLDPCHTVVSGVADSPQSKCRFCYHFCGITHLSFHQSESIETNDIIVKDDNCLLGLDWIALYKLRSLYNDPSRILGRWNGAGVVENYGADV